jgi:flagella basal body P-ring formation protein FlgA
MKQVLIALALLAAAAQAAAPQATPEPPSTEPGHLVVVTTRALRARAVIGPGDVTLAVREAPGALSDPAEALGLETSGWVQAGAALMPDHVVPAAIVERNQIVTLVFRKGMLEITTEGRALERAAPGDGVRTMNLESKTIVTGRAIAPGIVEVR